MSKFKRKTFFLILIVTLLTIVNFVVSGDVGDASKLGGQVPKEDGRLTEDRIPEANLNPEANPRPEEDFRAEEDLYGHQHNHNPHNRETEDVKFIAVVFRHGERTPDALYPKYPNQEETFYPHGLGELTNEGKRREYEIGRALRRRYNILLGPTVLPETVVARSSAMPRAKRSLLLTLAGLFPPSGNQIWNYGLDWQAIPTEYVDYDRDSKFFGIACTKSLLLFGEFQKSEEFKSKMASYADMFKIVSDNTGLKVEDCMVPMQWYFNFLGMKKMGMSIPEWTKNVWPRPMLNCTIDNYKFWTNNDEIIRYANGFMMKNILEEFTSIMNGTAPKAHKVSLYSGHEINVAFILRLLGVYFDHAPPFGAYVILELHQTKEPEGNIKGQYGVKVLYEDYERRFLKTFVIPGCTLVCPFEKLVDLIKNKLPGPDDKCDKVHILS